MKSIKGIVIGFGLSLWYPLVFAQGVYDIGVHDPVMIQHEGTYYLYCTGWGITAYSSKDLKTWTSEPRVFDKPPQWAKEAVTDFTGHIWAPDISFYDGKYYLYYSVSSFAKNTSAIGLATNVTLDPKSPNYQWKDQGMIIQSVPYRDLWNAIDPNIVVDEEGYPWMAFGSFWDGMKAVKLIPNRTAIAQPQEWKTIARRERSFELDDKDPGDAAIEAPFIFKKDTSYYLFVSWDYCCRGKESSYKVVVGRSESPLGPFIDREGKPMNQGGGTLVVEGNDRWAGAGHNSAYTFDGKDYLVFHGYDMQADGHAKLIIKEIKWSQDGWPEKIELKNK
ncbi:ABC transporter substrate-binding protein [Reichenbachiella sp. 5M10]|uniref:arabinan endo-1,5-alpha-L-arabinosidase n=1 Tax=Reichenbachiella sp. 5M10 TaxID=1889772 RepID=UPI000C15DF60|nr:arabinan endo-1,5-alpha-L-arabinosidase [Reichenbachiella sp. 5M10]PIB34696.1 ABC transporter substrate-binding protein [Reichenbachiella sp. 5M10]